jgi:FG-GAP repeat
VRVVRAKRVAMGAASVGLVLLGVGAPRASALSLSSDPFAQQGGMLSTEAPETREYPQELALSADGNTAIVGAPSLNGFQGAAWVYTRTGSTWTRQQELVGKGASKLAHVGASVALSADGTTALVGAPEEEGESEKFFGATYVFVREGGEWHEQQKLVASTGATEKGAQGSAVALSANGNTALVGAKDNGFTGAVAVGAAFVFTRSGTTWSQQGGKLEGKHKEANVQEGTSVALSENGTTALIGGPREEAVSGKKETGAAWVFALEGGVWTEQAELPQGTGSGEESAQGQSVALSGDGDTALVGGPGYNSSLGAVWVYTRSGSAWTQQERLLGGHASAGAEFGSSVALSEDGNTALVGGPDDDSSVGAAWAFVRSGSTFGEEQTFVGEPAGAFASEGSSVALSADGLTAMIDAPVLGGAFAFARAGAGEEEHKGGEEHKGEEHKETPVTQTQTQQTGAGNTQTPGIATTPAAIEELLLGCSGDPLVLNDVYIRGSRVLIAGRAAKSLVGRKVTIVFGTALKKVATAIVQPDGQFTTTAPLPPARIQGDVTTRYMAELGKLRSLHLKLTRRLQLEPPTHAGTTVTLQGHIVLPLTKPVAPIVVEEELECHKTAVVEHVTPPRSGRFHITLTVPAAARAGIFTLKSKVAGNLHSLTHGFTTYSLPLPAALG